MVRYKLQTLTRVFRAAFAIGALSPLLSVTVSSSLGGLITGRIVESDSGNRRVKKRVDACLYIFEICEEACREVEEEREEIEDVRSWEEESVSRVGESVVAIEV